MRKKPVSYSVSDIEHMALISQNTNVPEPVLYRRAVREFIERHHLHD